MGDPVIGWMQQNGVEVCRENYLALCFGNNEPEECDLGPEWRWPPELQEEEEEGTHEQ